MNSDLWAPCGERFAQGDLLLAPIGLFTAADLIDRPEWVDEPGALLTTKHAEGIAASIPRLAVNGTPVILRAWYMPAIVISPDCSFDKNGADTVVIAGVWPIEAYERDDQDGVRLGTHLNGFHLPADTDVAYRDGSSGEWPESVVDLASVTTVNPGLVYDQRSVRLSDTQIDRFQECLLRHYAGREISSTGIVNGMVGRKLIEVETIESSNRRHTVVLTFDDDSFVVLYQEPRKKAEARQSILVKNGTFGRAIVAATAGNDLLLRFENEDPREWHVTCKEIGVLNHLLKRGTTSILLRAVPAGVHTFVNADKRQQTFRLEVG